MNNNLISIIIPIYNVEKYIRKCIDSVINQTYKNLEIILVDDGSTDNSGNICEEYKKKDSRIKVIHKKNGGVSSAKNAGIEESTGNFIAFIDGDDSVAVDYCEILYRNIVDTDSDFSMVSYKVVKDDGTIITDAAKDNDMTENEVIIYENEDIITEILKQKTLKNFVCKMYKKGIVHNFPIGVTYEDIVYTYEIGKKSIRAVYINNSCYNYLKRNDSLTAVYSEKNMLDFNNAILSRYQMVSENHPNLMRYNVHSFLASTIALSSQNILSNRKYASVDEKVIKLINIIIEYTKENEQELLPLLNDFQKICLYLMRYNVDLYYSFLKEYRQLRNEGKIK